MVVASLICGVMNGSLNAVSQAAAEGAQSAVTLCLSMAGMLCLWNGVLEVMNRSGLTAALRRLLRPFLRRLYPAFQDNAPVMDAVSANVCANLLGLGNAATPFGLRAARGWRSTAAALQMTACWWCATRLPFSCCPPPWPLCGRGPDAPRPSVFSQCELLSFATLAAGPTAAALLRRVWP